MNIFKIFFSQKFVFLFIFFLLLTLPATVFLALKQQEIRKKAAEQQVATPETPPKPEYVPGEVLVKLRSKIPEASLEQKALAFSELATKSLPPTLLTIHDQFKIKEIEKLVKEKETESQTLRFKSNLSTIYKLKLEETDKVTEAVELLNKDPNILEASPNYYRYINILPNDSFFNRQWSLNQESDFDIDAPEAWDISTGSNQVVVGIIDSGIDFSHPDLENKIYINLGEYGDGKENNGIDDDENGFIDDWHGWDFVNDDNDPVDDNGHGTHVGGIIGARTNNSVGVAGISWDSPLFPVKICDSKGRCPCDAVVRGISYASRFVQIENLSIGGSMTCVGEKEAIEEADGRGSLIVAAAGNSNSFSPSYPAFHEEVIAVAALDQNDKKTSFSNYGEWVDISAPGKDIWSTILPGAILSATCRDDDGDGYDDCSGTSMSSPIVAGVASLIKSKYPDFDNEKIKTILFLSTDKIDAFNPAFERKLGRGRVNAHQALTKTVFPEITSPTKKYTLNQAVIEIKGTAWSINLESFSYELDYSLDGRNWQNEGISYPNSNNTQQVIDGFLGFLNTSTLANGEYILRLRTTASGQTEEAKSTFVFNRDAPIVLQEGWPQVCEDCGGTGTSPFNPTIPFTSRPQDNNLRIIGSLFGTDLWQPNGEKLPNWPPAVLQEAGVLGTYKMFADWNSDGQQEVFVLRKFRNPLNIYEYCDDFYWFDSLGNELLHKGLPCQRQMETIQLRALSISDINKDGEPEVILVSDKWEYYLGSDGRYHIRLVGTKLSVYNKELELKWEKLFNNFVVYMPQQTLVVGNVDGDDKEEIFLGLQSRSLPITSRIYAFKNNGEGLTNAEGIFKEYLWENLESNIPSSLLLGDINYDDSKELVGKFDYSKLRAFNSSGSLLWEKILPGYEIGSPALGDLDNNGTLEIVFGSTIIKNINNEYQWFAQLRAYKFDGSGFLNADGLLYEEFLGNYDYDLPGPFFYPSAVVLGDINGDNASDILTSWRESDKLYAFSLTDNNNDGQVDILSGWPITVEGKIAYFTSLGGDTDGDGDSEILALSTNNAVSFFVFSAKGQFNEENLFWPLARYNERFTGTHPPRLLPIPTNTPPIPTTTPTPTPTLVPNPTYIPNPGKGAFFNEKTYIEIRQPDNLGFNNTDNFTIETWVNPKLKLDYNNGFHFILARKLSVAGTNYSFFLHMDPRNNTANMRFAIVNKGIQSDYIIPAEGWSHLAAVKDGNFLELFLNGQLVKSEAFEFESLTNIEGKTLIGGWPVPYQQNPMEAFHGTIDDLRVSNIARDVEKDWRNGVYFQSLPTDENTLALWRFEENLEDSSQNGNNGEGHGDISFVDGRVPAVTPTPPIGGPTEIPTLPPTPTATPTATPEPTATPSPTPLPTPTATPLPTNTPIPTPTATPIPTATLTPTVTPIPCSRGEDGNLDCSLNGCIYTADFELFRQDFGKLVSELNVPVGHHTPDLVVDQNNRIDTADYEILRANFGTCSPGFTLGQ